MFIILFLQYPNTSVSNIFLNNIKFMVLNIFSTRIIETYHRFLRVKVILKFIFITLTRLIRLEVIRYKELTGCGLSWTCRPGLKRQSPPTRCSRYVQAIADINYTFTCTAGRGVSQRMKHSHASPTTDNFADCWKRVGRLRVTSIAPPDNCIIM